MNSIDLFGILAFILFIVFRAMAESGRQKQQHRRKGEQRETMRPNPTAPRPVARPLEEVFPPILSFPWEEKPEVGEKAPVDKRRKAEKTPAQLEEGYGFEEVSLEGYSSEGTGTESDPWAEPSTEGYGTEGWGTEGARESAQVKTRPNLTQDPELATGRQAAARTGLPMEPAEVIRGFVWSEILQPPKAKRHSGLRPNH